MRNKNYLPLYMCPSVLYKNAWHLACSGKNLLKSPCLRQLRRAIVVACRAGHHLTMKGIIYCVKGNVTKLWNMDRMKCNLIRPLSVV